MSSMGTGASTGTWMCVLWIVGCGYAFMGVALYDCIVPYEQSAIAGIMDTHTLQACILQFYNFDLVA